MDAARDMTRSGSNSSLHHAYKAHARHAPSGPGAQPLAQRRPLRSVNENSALLRSPGPLGSMLKTATETGDIGLFSIKGAVSPATYHQPPRHRPNLGDAGLLPPPRSKLHELHEDRYSPEHHKRLRSYRDTTSEIISLYGSDNRQYWLRSPSPALDDGQRSFSLTTCSSRQMSSQKSSGTLQSHSSGGGGLQRPRSPFPYPTRLKRPGVRPASPALAENGGIDYTRMVELDRVSQVSWRRRVAGGTHETNDPTEDCAWILQADVRPWSEATSSLVPPPRCQQIGILVAPERIARAVPLWFCPHSNPGPELISPGAAVSASWASRMFCRSERTLVEPNIHR